MVLAAALVCISAGSAGAQLAVSGGIESFHWTEATSPRAVEERGPLAAVTVGWTQAPARALRVAYRSRYYLGWVDYSGSYLFAPDSTARGTTGYAGLSQEGQLRARMIPALDAYGGLGVELWRRSLSGGTREDFNVSYARLGIGGHPAGSNWSVDAGAKFVLGASENAHLDQLGFGRNPILEPRGMASGYGQLGVQLRGDWAVQAYFDGYRFQPSPTVVVAKTRTKVTTVRQPGSDLSVLGLKLVRHF